MIDGTIARKTGTESAFGAKLDSLADLIFVIVASLKILPAIRFLPIIWIWIGVIAAIKIYVAILIIRRKEEASVHTIANKITGFLLFIWPFTVNIINVNYSAIIVCVAATFACIQELILSKRFSK